MNIKRSLGYFTALLFAVITLFACNNMGSKKSKLNEEIKQTMSKYEAIGLAVVAVKDGEIIYNKNFGYKDLENKVELAENDLFRIASISKSFTSIGIMQLVEQGKIKLDDKVSDYVGFDVVNPKYPNTPITIKMLLSHTSSLNDSEGYFTLDVIDPKASSTYAKAYNNYEPGTNYEYCNLGYNTLGTILERVSGVRFDKYIIENILTPLGAYGGYENASLDSTKFVKLYSYNNGEFKHSPAAYALRSEEINNYKFGLSTPIFSPTGGLKISAEDLAKVMNMHMNLGVGKNFENGTEVKILDKSSAEAMQSIIAPKTDEGDAYGLALRISKQFIDGKTMIGHTGSAYGVFTSMFWDSEHNFGIITMTNGCRPDRESNFMAISREVSNQVYNNLIKE